MKPPVIGFSAYSGAGKTTLLEQLIPRLTARGLRVGVVKHSHHALALDQPGKDSDRHRKAGAAAVAVAGPGESAVLRPREMCLDECVRALGDVDLVLVEGFRHADIPRIGLSRRAAGAALPEPPEAYLAVVTDDASAAGDRPCFTPDDIDGLADFLIKEAFPVPEQDFTHFDDEGRARMVDVGDKAPTRREAVAVGRVLVSRATFDLIRSGGVKKGDVLTVAQIAGIMAAKRTPDWIPMCHPIPLSGIDLRLWLDEARLSVEIEASVRCDGRTGVEMEALTAVSGAALTVYDMCKAVQRDMVIADIRLMQKTGGVHGDYRREDA